MKLEELKPNKILRGLLFPGPAQVIAVLPMRTRVKFIGEGFQTNKVVGLVLAPEKLALLETPEIEPFGARQLSALGRGPAVVHPSPLPEPGRVVIARQRPFVVVGSANLTDDAFSRNMELGLMVRDPQTVFALADHFLELIRRGDLAPVKPNPA